MLRDPITYTRERIYWENGRQFNNVSDIDARSVEKPQRVTNLERLIERTVEETREERRCREAIAAMATEGVTTVGQAQASETKEEV